MNSISTGTLVFGHYASLSSPAITDPTRITLNNIIPGNDTSYVVHPNLNAGWNPPINFYFGVVNYDRPIFVSTTNPGAIVCGQKLPPSITEIVQATGRLSRH